MKITLVSSFEKRIIIIVKREQEKGEMKMIDGSGAGGKPLRWLG